MHYKAGDTIAAISTATGVAAVGMIRLSGPKSVEILTGVFSKDLLNAKPYSLHHGWIRKGAENLDEVLVSIFRAPQSYTGEDVVEVSCHGSPFILGSVLDLFLEKGARLAGPGEFTLRAFLFGKLDLSQAEAVADMINVDSEAAHRIAIQHMRGGFSIKLQTLRTQLIHFASLIELELDFSEEDVEFANRDQLIKLLIEIEKETKMLLDSFRQGNAIKEGIITVIAGRPNAGKSTLLNALLKEDRAIVSEIPGTTRDTIEEILSISGLKFRLIDTAGIREAGDAIEKIGIEKTFEKIDQSALLLYIYDADQLNPNEVEKDLLSLQREGLEILAIANKSDLLEEVDKRKIPSAHFLVSAKKEVAIEQLKTEMIQRVQSGFVEESNIIISNIRHADALRRASISLQEVMQGVNQKISGELLAIDIRRALDALGEITGAVATNDLLENIFSKFCIGK